MSAVKYIFALISKCIMEQRKNKFVVVDDSSFFFNHLKECLESQVHPFRIKQAGSFSETARILDENEVHIILLKIKPIQTNHFELLSTLRDLYPDVSIVIFSKKHRQYHLSQLKKIGAAYFGRTFPS